MYRKAQAVGAEAKRLSPSASERLGFDSNHIELHQVLGVKLQPDGTSGMPLRPDWEIPRVLAR